MEKPTKLELEVRNGAEAFLSVGIRFIRESEKGRGGFKKSYEFVALV